MNKTQLSEALITPSPRLLADLKKISGDFIILGAGGKMGPSLSLLLRRALLTNGMDARVYAVSRFSFAARREELDREGIVTLAGDLLEDSFLATLPRVKNVLYLAGYKFGASENQALTWAMNSYLPGRIASLYSEANIVAFSSGNIYPFVPIDGMGATEKTAPDPVGEYAQSCLGRERLFEYFSQKNNTPTLIYRLNYALDLRYGVLNDIAQLVRSQTAIDLRMGYVNVIWQGDANEYAIRCLRHCQAPANILNITGPEKLSVRFIAERFGQLFNQKPKFSGTPQTTALLNDASRAHELFGAPNVSADQLIDWTAAWIKEDGEQINKPTHFQERKGNF